VQLKFPSGFTVAADVEDFGDDFVQAKVSEDFGGVLQTLCKIVVTSSLDIECETNATFTPAEEIIAIGSGGTELSASSKTVFNSLVFSLFGDKRRFTLHDFTLKNGWVVDDSVLEVHDSGINAGAYYVQKPGRGTTYAKTIVEVWADAYSRCSAEETLFIKGPQGVAYQ
jgi:hypothetical protein